jgi:hypothetical protein
LRRIFFNAEGEIFLKFSPRSAVKFGYAITRPFRDAVAITPVQKLAFQTPLLAQVSKYRAMVVGIIRTAPGAV